MTRSALHRVALPLAVAGAVLALVGAVAYLAGRGGDTVAGPGNQEPPISTPLGPGQGVEPKPGTPAQDNPNSRFTAVRPGPDGQTLDVTFWGGVKECFEYTVTAREDAARVRLTLVERSRHSGPCIELAQEHTRAVRLDEPLAAREVVDAQTGTVLLAPSP